MEFKNTRKFRELTDHFVRVGEEIRYLTTREERAANLVARYRAVDYVTEAQLRQVIAKANQRLHKKIFTL